MPPLVRSMHPLRLLLLIVLLAGLSGCFSEGSFPANFERLVRVSNADRVPARPWAARLHQAAAPLLPAGRNEALTTDELSAAGGPADVWARFNLHPENLDNLFLNYRAIEQTAQSASLGATSAGKPLERPDWPGFHEVKVPVGGNAVLCGRLGDPEKQYEIPGSYVVMTHGLFGSLDGPDVINHVQALRRAGHHVLAIEMRGHGQTQRSYPKCTMTFGLAESGDYLAVARWLKETQGAARVGLVSFSLTGYEALLAAWLDGTAPVTELKDRPLSALLPARQAEPAFNGGMFIVSAPINIIDIAKSFEPRFNLLQAPVKATFQNQVCARIESLPPTESYAPRTGHSMWDLARCEFLNAEYRPLYATFDAAQADLDEFLDLSRDNWKAGAARMENIRVPVLILNAASDPLASGQGVADLFSRQHNPNIGVILLKEGGHIGFTAYSADYYFSLMTNFFDPATAPVISPAP